jgi:RNA polymerase sigma-70 factor (family 1)
MEEAVGQDEYWIQAFRKGDDRALAYFFKLHYKSLCYFIQKILHNQAEAEDIAAVAFVKLWERRANFDSTQKIKSFLFVTCKNASIDYLKQLSRRTVDQQNYLQHLEQLDVEVLNGVIESEFLNSLHQELLLLPDQCRKVFSMLYFEGKKTAEIATAMGLSVKTVRNYKARSLEILNNSFMKRGISDAIAFAIFIYLNKK